MKTGRDVRQFRTRARVIETREGRALSIKFNLGPFEIFVIANLPEDDAKPLAYVKASLASREDWKRFPEGDK